MPDAFFPQKIPFAPLPHNPDRLTEDLLGLLLHNPDQTTVDSGGRRSPQPNKNFLQTQLQQAIERRCLGDCLTILENAGYRNQDTQIFLIAATQLFS